MWKKLRIISTGKMLTLEKCISAGECVVVLETKNMYLCSVLLMRKRRVVLVLREEESFKIYEWFVRRGVLVETLFYW